MPEQIEQAWRRLAEGDPGSAEALFQEHLRREEHRAEALEGLGYCKLARGQARQAEEHALEALHAEPTPQRRLLLGEALGQRGKRREAQHVLEDVCDALPPDQQAYGRALLGEQMIRRGQWEAGTEAFLAALKMDARTPGPRGDAYTQLKRVLGDLVDALSAGKVPEKEALRFVNQLDYRAPQHDAQMESFFSEVRRAITSREPLSGTGRNDGFTFPPHVRSAAGSASARPDLTGPPAQRAVDERADRPPSAPPSTEETSDEERIDANKKDLQKVIERERSENAGLLSEIEEMGPPEWPSKAGYDSLDTVEAVSLDRGSIIGGSNNIDTRDFRLTSGDLLTQIFLERCLRNLLATTQRGKSRGFLLRPESIPMMELNCRDGLFEAMRPLSSIHEDRPGYDDYHQLAFGTFIGECLVETHDGTWAYETDPYQVRLRIGEERFDPMGLARRWMEAEDKDQVHLEALIRRAERAGEASSQMTVAKDYIDPTRELTTESLPATLAERWVEYRVQLEEVSFAEIAETIEVLDNRDEVIVFRLGAQWVPSFACGPDHAGIFPDGTVGMAYLRRSGEFAPLASRKGMTRHLEVTGDELGQEEARRIVSDLVQLHRPRWEFAVDEDRARSLQRESADDFQAPRLEADTDQTRLLVEAASPTGKVTYEITHNPGEVLPWKVECRQ